MDKNLIVLSANKIGGEIVQIDPKNRSGSYIKPLEAVDSKITVRDLLDSFGNIKPFEVVSQVTGITLEMYQQAVSIIRIARGQNTSY
ncbi:hypothetical protein [Paenibacillus sp. VTT E-133291]|uniref:hypothetical protein n=1 Tax=Paenibacillus sp. VTT E-133291 TaxID=1986223 RepID=UPI000BA05EE8|nr:hypothetical protein [Paenibacillus sp. VTT E-133291]OZQ97336.1 hypothetical protein CA598_05960 [Paenibacillus sp. VTT E-133291]